MPNHEQVTQSGKGFTAREANEILGRNETFWQDESYDALLHDQHDLDRVIGYIARNPIRAKLDS
jgi:hypothetical protein